ncbi:2'-5' RNA ligase [Algoriphagus boseongensis]|uniref:2'-5' RNA ligase n=1 Tax=Algoriphagus boseongensis TaxID=1442587 RepID=A0A4R6T693_9BACT|nr:RNA 2',3'-cyclic phosphodiesterase [Algoriphagus boseongensis]TDQ17192.1 2'-5' RNA ligase [Algoriphagus boseongensis]
MQKYFLAIVPPEPVLSQAEGIKQEIKERFNVKYALKSPAHITLKMPFTYNEAKEEALVEKLSQFLSGGPAFPLKIGGIETFGNRVIFLGVEKNSQLIQLQSSLKIFCKKDLHLVDELSDRNFHPHMTLAFKDLKPSKFQEVLHLAKEMAFDAEFLVNEIALLKRIEGRWILCRKLPLGRIV